MTQALADALTPIFVGLLLGFYAGRRGLMDNLNVHNLIVLVMNFAVPCAMFLIIAQSSRSAILLELNSALAIALVFGLLFAGCYFWARRFWTLPVPDAAVLALTIGFPNCAAVALSLLSGVFGSEAVISAALSIAVGSITISPVTLALLELSSKKDAAKITALPLLRGIARSFRQPVVWSPILALLFVFCGLHLPPYGVATVRTLGNAANGSALLLTGVVISAQYFTLNGPVVLTTLAKLIGQPLLAIAISLLLKLNHEQVREVALISAIPGGFFGLVFGKLFNSTPQSASSGLIASYVLSVVTLPLWILILTRFF
jgi:malonate transporter and related proteins